MEPIMSKPIYVARKINDLKDMLEQVVALHSDKDAFIRKNKENYIGVSYKKFKDDVFGLGTELVNLGAENNNVIILSENRYEWCVAFLAIACAEGVAIPIDSDIEEDKIIDEIKQFNPRIIIFSEKYRELLIKIKRDTELEYFIDMDTIIEDKENYSFLRLIEDGNKYIQNGNDEFLKKEIDNEKDVAIFKGETIIDKNYVVFSNKNLVSSVMGILSFLPITSSDKSPIISHLSNPFQCFFNFLTILAQGGTICFCNNIYDFKEYNPTICFVNENVLEENYKIIWENVGNMPNVRKVKILMFISFILTKINIDIRSRLFTKVLKPLGNNFKTMIVVGKEFNNKILKDFTTWGIKVIEACPLLEASGLIMVNKKREFFRENIMGLPLPGLKACILNSNGRVPGEITLKGNYIMKGYYNNKRDTEKIINDGILYTGKIGYRDSNGRFYFSRNKKK